MRNAGHHLPRRQGVPSARRNRRCSCRAASDGRTAHPAVVSRAGAPTVALRRPSCSTGVVATTVSACDCMGALIGGGLEIERNTLARANPPLTAFAAPFVKGGRLSSLPTLKKGAGTRGVPGDLLALAAPMAPHRTAPPHRLSVDRIGLITE